jgi:predicted transglutaminase-like cysteine proteinase
MLDAVLPRSALIFLAFSPFFPALPLPAPFPSFLTQPLRRHRRALAVAAIAVLAWLPITQGLAGLVDFSQGLITYIGNRFGAPAVERLNIWKGLVNQMKAATPPETLRTARTVNDQTDLPVLRKVNAFFNQLPYRTDQQTWGVADYWATPVEALAVYAADCEDYSIAKYMTLKELGIPVERLRITYVRALRLGETHMVLAYYATPDSDPLILDNINKDIRPGSDRDDLEPVFGFNDDDLWAVGGARSAGGASQVRMWKGLQEKMERERHM